MVLRAHQHRRLGGRSVRSPVGTVAAAVRPNYFPGSTPPKHLATAQCQAIMASTRLVSVRSDLHHFSPCTLARLDPPSVLKVSRFVRDKLADRLLTSPPPGEDKAALAWYQQAELMHARWAMLGVAGMAAPEIVGNPFVDGPLPNWADAHRFFDGSLSLTPTLCLLCKMFMMNWAEVRRWQDMKNPGFRAC